jgi:hypothetical protein
MARKQAALIVLRTKIVNFSLLAIICHQVKYRFFKNELFYKVI